jgi:tetratricopeptide (TPR) repeat protein
MRSLNYLLVAVLAVIFNCITLQTHSQGLKGQALVDSLKNELQKKKSDSDQVRTILRLARAMMSIDPDVAMHYADSGMQLARQRQWLTGVGLAYINKARIYRSNGDYAAGLQHADTSYDIFRAVKWKAAVGDALFEIANNYERLGNYSKAIENNYKALRIYEEIDLKPSIAGIYNNLGIAYYRLDDYPKAIENYGKALEIDRKLNDKFGIASALDNMASVYKEQGKIEKVNELNLEAIRIFEEIHDEAAMGRIYINRGNFMQQQNYFDSALSYYRKAITIADKLEIKSTQAFGYGGIGEIYLKVANDSPSKNSLPDSLKANKPSLLKKANEYFTKAYDLSTRMGELSLMMRFAKSLSDTRAASGDYKSALAFYDKAVQHKDSIFNDENKRKVAALETERVAQVKDKEIQILNKDKALQASEIRRQTQIRNAVLAAVGLAAIFSFFLIRSFTRRRKITFEKQMLQTEMKALRAQMNPHFIFNSLHSINKYVMENDKENASEYLAKFAKLMRLVLENSRELEVPLENDLAALELYMQLEALRFGNKFQYSIEIDPNIDKENTLIPPLMLQPFAENAIVHGMKDKEDGLIKIKIQAAEGNMIKCVVEDNGVGRSSVPVVEETTKKRKSLGLKIMQERLNVINQLRKAKAAVHIFDLKDAENKPGGLRIELLLPLQLAF